jgi:alcohol-forming fatty acyl-CoA reductase
MTIAAFFDVDGTLTRTTIIHPLIWYQRDRLSAWQQIVRSAGLILQAPIYWLIDRRSRGQFNIVFYRRYAGLDAEDLRDWHRRTFARNLQRAIFPDALACVRAHQQQGHRIVLVTGGLDFVMEALAEFLGADDLLAIRLQESAGVFTGELKGAPIADEEKANLIRTWGQPDAIDLKQSFAYGNNWGDVPMLAAVGHPVAVNPDRRLKRLAKERAWPIMRWTLR